VPSGSSDGSLSGAVVAVTADRRSGEQIELLERRGATVLHCPTIATVKLDADSPLKAATEVAIAAHPDFVAFTTGMGARMWMAAAETLGLADSLLAMWNGARVLARGPKSTAALRSFGVTTWRSAEHETAGELVAILAAEAPEGSTVVVQAHGRHDDRFASTLSPRGCRVIEVPVYSWNLPDDLGPARDLVDRVISRTVDAVTFTAAPAVRNLLAVAEQDHRDGELLDAFNEGRGVIAACVGPVCAAAARETGFTKPIWPDVGRLGLLVRALGDEFDRRRPGANP
jgi:uroporphyrinogen-III synthase